MLLKNGLKAYVDYCNEMDWYKSAHGQTWFNAFDKNASAIYGTFLTEIYTANREKFIEVAKPIHEEYFRMKSEDDVYWKKSR